MYNNDGSIKYDKIKDGSRVWVLEEKEDGTYGNYALIENAQGLSDEKIQEAAKTATTKFSKAEVEKLGGIKETDSIVVYETNTYAARKQSTTQYGKDFYFANTVSSSNLHKEYIDEIYKVGLNGLEKQGEKYFYKGKEVSTIDNFKKYPIDDTPKPLGYTTDRDNKYWFESLDSYVVSTSYYDVISDFLIKHPDSPIFANRRDDVFWAPEEYNYFAESFVARLINTSFNKKYNLTTETENFNNKQLETKSENSRPTEKKTYSFVKTELNGDEDSYFESTHNNADDTWKQEIGLSYSTENVEKVRNWIKGSQSLSGYTINDPFNDKDASEVSKEDYTNAVFTQISSIYYTTIKDNFTPEQIKALRSKFGDSPFMLAGNSIVNNNGDAEILNYSLTGVAPTIYRNSLGVVTENTETFTYHDVITPLRAYRLTADNNVVRHVYEQVKRGSVVATYSDEDGNKLADDVNVKTNEYEGEDYQTEAKQIRPIYNYETVNGLTKTTTTTYELIKTPDNANGKVVAETTTVVPYVYRKIVTVDIKGSVIATYKDEEGTILASEEKVITNQNAGTYYAAASKPIQASTSSQETEHGRKVTVITYELIKTPDNETGEVVGGETLVVPYVYRKVVTVKSDGGVVATHKDTEGNDLAPKEVIKSHAPNGEAYTTSAKEIPSKVVTDKTPEGFTRTTTTTYTLVENPTNKDGDVVGGETITVPYVYKKVVKQDINGSVIVTHHDENGVQLAPDETVKDNAKAGEHYTTSPKRFDSSITTNHVNGLTQTTYAHYELSRIPSNDQGEVEGGKTTIVPYIYRRVERIVTNGSVVATYKDTEGNELAPQVNVKTDVEPGQAYDTEVKTFATESISESKPTDDVVKVTVTEYRLVKTPENKSGEVKDGQTIVVPYVYEKVVSVHYEKKDKPKQEFEIPNEAPKVEKDELKLTRFMLEDRKTEINPSVEGLVKPIQTISNYVYTGATDSNESGDVITHIYKLVEPEVPNVSELPKDSPVHDKPEFNGGVIPNDAPVHDKPEYKGGIVPNDAPVHDKPEFNGGVVPNDPPVHDKPEYNGGVVPNDSPVHDKPKLDVPTPNIPTPEFPKPETPSVETPKPSQPLEQKPQEKYVTKELPNTGGSESSTLGLLGFAGVMGSLLLLKKQKED
jgi:zinc metalloproteinase C